MLKRIRLSISSVIIQTFLIFMLGTNAGLAQVEDASDFILLDDVSAKKTEPAPPATDDAPQATGTPAEIANPDVAGEAAQRERQAILMEKRRKASIGLAAVAGIAILGITIIAVAMIWAKRLRRIARDPLPVQRTAGNDFWFLKPPKPTVEDKEIVDTHRPEHPPADSD